ncbi:MAG: NUDIX hydrolase [PVC group bacterium]|nr:NUDIX hydrolase [PVC group bacterium]
MYKTQEEISAGGVVFKSESGVIRVVMIRRTQGTVWCLPKGKIESGETKEQAALREVQEETGAIAEIQDFLGDVKYEYTDPRRTLHLKKTVRFFLMKWAGHDKHYYDHEGNNATWFDLEKAIESATYPGEKQILQEANTFLQKTE